MIEIKKIAQKIGLKTEDLELYGDYMAKIKENVWERVKNNPDGKLILVTAMTPTPSGEGKTTTTIALTQALWQLKKTAIAALREPSLGPVFGMKGGATGGGKSCVEPSEEINLHFTGDFHAIAAAQNLLCAMVDNHLYWGNKLGIKKIVIPRCLDINDRTLRKGFVITAASELMAIVGLAKDEKDLKERLEKIIIGYDEKNNAVTAKNVKVIGAMMKLLSHTLQPNLVQTTEECPSIIHTGPFANIAHGCSSIRGTKLSLKLADYVVTEAGFGADLGAEKFFDIKCRIGDLKPSCVVIVATTRAIKYHPQGLENLKRHVQNCQKFSVPVVVTINKFNDDREEELKYLITEIKKWGLECAICEGYEKGGEGALELAKLVQTFQSPSKVKYIYDLNDPIKTKIEKIAKEIYGADGVEYSPEAENFISNFNLPAGGQISNLPVCIAKTQYSFSDNPELLGVPTGFKIVVRDIQVAAGAGFIIVITGKIMTMPGLPKHPLAEEM